MNKPSARIGFSLTLGLALTVAVLWLAGGGLRLASAAGPWFVDAATGSDAQGCLSAGDACLTIGEVVSRASSGDVINVAAGTYAENVVIAGKALTFIGASAASTFVDGGGTGRVFETDSDLAAFDLTIQNGNSGGDGGGLYATAAVTLTRVNVFSSTASSNGGGVYASGAAAFFGSLFRGNGGSQGGGAYLGSTVWLSDTQFISNTAASWGGGAQAVLAAEVSGGLFQENNAGSSGGGLFAQAGLIVTGTQFVSNTAGTAFGGGVYAGGAAALSGASFSNNAGDTGGGAEFDGATTIIDSTFFNNTATDKGGGAYFNAVAAVTNTVFSLNLATSGAAGGGAGFGYTATVSGGAFISNVADFAGGGAYFNGLATIDGTDFSGNTAANNRGGGAYFNEPAAISGAAFTANQTPADRGAGAYFRDAASLTNTDFVGNQTPNRGGGAYFNASAALTGTRFLSNTAGVHGGGAYFGAVFQLLDSQFISNTAVAGSGGGAFQAGIGNGLIVNGLFTRNGSGDAGEDLLLGTLGTTTLLHTTLANSSQNPGAAVFVSAGSVAVTNTLFANAEAGLVISGGVSASSDYNLFFNAPTNAVTGTHSLSDTNPLFVNPAADNYRLGAGSPAAGAGQEVGVATDLDGAPRGTLPSIGAYELPTYELTVATDGTGQGSVTQVPSQTIYAQGTMVTLTATPDSGSTFAGWSGDVSGLANPITITLTSNTSVTATFNLTPPDPLADLAIGVEGSPAQAAPAGIVTYTLVVTNTGPDDAVSVSLTDTLDVSSTFQSLISPAGWLCIAPGVGSTGQIVCTLASLGAELPAVFTITVQLDGALPAAAVVTNTATVTSATPDPTTPNVASANTTLYAFRNHWPLIGH